MSQDAGTIGSDITLNAIGRIAHTSVIVVLSLASLPQGAPASEPSDFASRAAAIVQETSRFRGLAVAGDIPLTFIDRDELRRSVLDEFLADYSPADLEADQRTLAAFGFTWGPVDLRKVYADLYSSWVSGYYDTETDQRHVVDDDARLDPEDEPTLVHEITHALQDQAFDLELIAGRPAAEVSADAQLAFNALVEGDARVTEADYMRRHPALSGILRDAADASPDPAPSDESDDWYVPPIIGQTFHFPYEAGPVFVRYLLATGGWDAVNRAYADPPTTTEQVLHPERYVERDEPQSIALRDLSARLGPAWRRINDDSLGEFQTGALLWSTLAADDVHRAAGGWDGDRFALWVSGEQTLLVWDSVWDSARDAGDFAAALAENESSRFAAPISAGRPGRRIILAQGAAVTIDLVGSHVRYVFATSDGLAKVGESAFAAALPALPAPFASTRSIARPLAAECSVEAPALDELIALVGTSPTPTPLPSAPPSGRPSAGLPPGDERAAAPLHELIACWNADAWLSAYALFTDDGLRRQWIWYWPPTPNDLAELALLGGTAEGFGWGVMLDLRRVEPLAEGRVGILFTLVSPVFLFGSHATRSGFAVGVHDGDRWAIDELYLD